MFDNICKQKSTWNLLPVVHTDLAQTVSISGYPENKDGLFISCFCIIIEFIIEYYYWKTLKALESS